MMKVPVFLILRVLTISITFSLAAPVVAHAEEISTSETTLNYARQTVGQVLGADFGLVPGSIQISLRQPTIVDIGGAVRAVFGAEKVEYQVEFQVSDRARTVYRGRTFMTVEATNSTQANRDEDNNTTLRGTDVGTKRLIKIQLYEYQDVPQKITPKCFDLRRLARG